jgi:hypothetical protein
MDNSNMDNSNMDNSNMNNDEMNDIYSQKILTRNTLYNYSSVPHTRENIKKFIDTRQFRHKENMYNISPPPTDNTYSINFTFTKFQKENHLHNNTPAVANRIFNSCIYANSEEGELGCNDTNAKLFSNYIEKNQKVNYSVLKSADADIDEQKFGNMFYGK